MWQYPGMGGWFFVSIPADISKEISEKFHDRKKGWGSLPVEAIVGKTKWNTSIFPDKKTKEYVLPLKSEVRKKEEISMGSIVHFMITIQT